MRVRCHLRGRRGSRSLRTIACETGLSIGELSMIERGHLLPLDAWIEKLSAAYGGTPDDWYPVGVTKAAGGDIRRCPGCGLDLAPDANRRRVYHDSACRTLAANRPPDPKGTACSGSSSPSS